MTHVRLELTDQEVALLKAYHWLRVSERLGNGETHTSPADFFPPEMEDSLLEALADAAGYDVAVGFDGE